jgi:hypothetical protein
MKEMTTKGKVARQILQIRKPLFPKTPHRVQRRSSPRRFLGRCFQMISGQREAPHNEVAQWQEEPQRLEDKLERMRTAQ